MAIIRLDEPEGYPGLIPGKEPFCIRCGHCLAVCPHGALSHAEIPVDDCPPLDKALSISEEQAVQFLRSRRSIRFFKDRPVEKETIQEIDRDRPVCPHRQQCPTGGMAGVYRQR